MIGVREGDANRTGETELGTLLALGVERRILRACLLEPMAGGHRLVGWISVQRDPGRELTQQLSIVCQRLGARLGRHLWDDESRAPFTISADPARYPPIAQVLAASTPRELLRVWAAGLSAADSLAATKASIYAAPARVVGESTLTAPINVAELAHQFTANRPDVLVISGGYDNPGSSVDRPIMQLSRTMVELLRRLPPGERPLVLYAGDRWAAPHAMNLLQSVSDSLVVEVVDNVRPSPDRMQTASLAARLTDEQWSLAERMPGFIRLARWVSDPARIMSLEANFTQAVRAWMEVEELPRLHALYYASAWRLHVLVEADNPYARVRYVEGTALDPILPGWPSAMLVCGLPPDGELAAPPRWLDRSGMLPVVASVGQVAPAAMLHALRHDLLAEDVNAP